MGKSKLNNDYRYNRAFELRDLIRDINKEIQVIDEAIAEMQIEKVKEEVKNNTRTNVLWRKFFHITKEEKTKKYFAEPSYYQKENSISLSEAELMFIRGFKQSMLEKLNEEVYELSKEINED